MVAVPAWSVVVPAKRLAVAKTRLRPLTDRADRPATAHDALVLALLADTVAAALACPPVGEVVVVTDEPAAASLVRRLGARTVGDEPDGGLNAALDHGARTAAGDAVAALSSDLPALRPAELAAALEAAAGAPRCFVPDVHGTGTTLLTAVGTPLRPRFGTASAQAHRDDGALTLTGDWPGLLRDVDALDDLRAALALGVGAHTADLLATSPTLAVQLGAAR
ncbi:2-phospho-L-lactate guanylyltransferase [Blastococcus goldschmidtiae]|uniref:Phosphoenolpyruvate guanylyltransferase n=1 Tax=Blastococcus goldschmidtiae TaxID=3075546 RepID=A0ABU2KAN2_9ACTN|nr:2-phospho-L-lactate guanylyltransferase [Blastococcus sp. DSM 46792]MDT0277251.1 2-phospho-L-lactate guanylyltransferase [Blastococcus sp. DSM 46792]